MTEQSNLAEAEKGKPTRRYTTSDKLGIALACLAGVMAIILFLVEKTPWTVAALLVAMAALLIYPVLHFAQSKNLRVLFLACVAIGTLAFGWYGWPKSNPRGSQSAATGVPATLPSKDTPAPETKTPETTPTKSGIVTTAAETEKIRPEDRPHPKRDARNAGANLDAVASVLAGNPAPMPATSTRSKTKAPVSASPPPSGMVACGDGRFAPEHHAEECGASNVTIRYNVGDALPVVSNGHGVSIHDNVVGPETPPQQPNKLEVKDPGTSFTSNTVRNMDASISNGASASNNLFEGRPNTGRTLSSVADQLSELIDNGHKIVAEFLKDDNPQLLSEKERDWEGNTRAVLTSTLGQRFADQFNTAQSTSTTYPMGHGAQGGSICNLVDSKIAVLITFVNQLRASGR
jgi:hypothetical protein